MSRYTNSTANLLSFCFNIYCKISTCAVIFCSPISAFVPLILFYFTERPCRSQQFGTIFISAQTYWSQYKFAAGFMWVFQIIAPLPVVHHLLPWIFHKFRLPNLWWAMCWFVLKLLSIMLNACDSASLREYSTTNTYLSYTLQYKSPSQFVCQLAHLCYVSTYVHMYRYRCIY